MIKLPNKDKCKLKQFNRALKVGMFVTMDFINTKVCCRNVWDGTNGELITRNMEPREKILKVVDKNKLELVYFKTEGELKTIREEWDWDLDKEIGYFYADRDKINPVFNAHNIWSWFQKDEVRNIRIMTKQELLQEYITELI